MKTERELTVELMNEALNEVSREKGYCLCIHPMMTVINFTGLACNWCEQPVTDGSYGPDAKSIRTIAVIAAYPWAVKAVEE
jgi:hypothetical protein